MSGNELNILSPGFLALFYNIGVAFAGLSAAMFLLITFVRVRDFFAWRSCVERRS